MREAIVTCTCISIRIPDLGITLSKGNVIHLPAQTAQASKDLAIAKKAFGVKVEYVEKCRSQRAGPGNVSPTPPPPSPPPAPSPPPLLPPVEPTPKKDEGIDLDALADKVALRMGQDVGDLRELIVETISGLALNATQAKNSGRVSPVPVSEPMPMFIPDNLVGGIDADIEVQQGGSEGSAVDEATATLRRMRKQRKS